MIRLTTSQLTFRLRLSRKNRLKKFSLMAAAPQNINGDINAGVPDWPSGYAGFHVALRLAAAGTP